jgi:ketosteroid isomerase-like protein
VNANPRDLLALARRWLACFETHDVDALVALYAPDARHTSPKLRVQRPETGGFVVGRAAMRDWWADAFARLPKLRYLEKQLTADGERVFMEYLRVTPGEPDLPVAEVLEVKDGLIAASRVYHG